MRVQLTLSGALLLAAWATAGAAPPAPCAAPQKAGNSPAAAPSRTNEAYYLFLHGRYLETQGEIDEAVKSYRQAAALDPSSAEILAELAALFARQDRAREAIETGEAALQRNAANAEANRVLGFIYAGLARVETAGRRLDAEAAAYASKAATHLEAARRTDRVADSNLDLALARVYLATGAMDKAIATLTRLTEAEPEQAEAVALLAEAYEGAGRPADAVALLEGAVAAQPAFLMPLAQLYADQERWDEAAGAYEKALARTPRSLETKTRLAIALLSSGNPGRSGRALEVLEQVREASPADPQVLYLLSQAQRTVGQPEAAEKTARELMTVAPSLLSGPYALAQALAARQQYRQVVEVLEPLIAKQSSPGGSELTPLLVHLGFAYHETGEHERATATFERARAASPSNPSIDLYLVQGYTAAGKHAAAIDLARKMRLARPDDQRVVRLEADALRAAGRLPEAVALLKGALASREDDPEAHVALAEIQSAGGQHDGALAVLERAAKRFPNDLSIRFQMGAVLERQKHYAEAERQFREVVSRDPLHAPALNYLGYMLAERGERLEEAIALIKRALQVEPHNGAYIDSLGWAYFKSNRLDLAEANIRKAAEQRVKDSAVQDHLGDVLFRLGRFAEAAAAWERALAGDGEQIDGAAVQQKLRTARAKEKNRP